MMIKAILQCYYSKRDINGSCYYAMRFIDTETGRQAFGRVHGGESNVAGIVHEMGLEWERVSYSVTQLPKKVFNTLVFNNGNAYAGCRAEELVAFINKEIYGTK